MQQPSSSLPTLPACPLASDLVPFVVTTICYALDHGDTYLLLASSPNPCLSAVQSHSCAMFREHAEIASALDVTCGRHELEGQSLTTSGHDDGQPNNMLCTGLARKRACTEAPRRRSKSWLTGTRAAIVSVRPGLTSPLISYQRQTQSAHVAANPPRGAPSQTVAQPAPSLCS